MASINTNSKAQYRLNNPLISKDFPVEEGEKLRIRFTAKPKLKVKSARALLCRIIFLDETNQEIAGNYEGTFISPVYGSYIYIESSVINGFGEWSKRTIMVPQAARIVRLIVLEGECKNSDFEEIQDIQCISGNSPFMETLLPLTGRVPTKLTLSFSEKIVNKNTVLLGIAYFDKNKKEIEGPYVNLALSRRYGYFKYINRTTLSHKFETSLLAPDGTEHVRIRLHSLSNQANLNCIRIPKLETYPVYSNVMGHPDWQCVYLDNKIRVAVPFDQADAQACKLNLSYLAFNTNGGFKFHYQAYDEKNCLLMDIPFFENGEKFHCLPDNDDATICKVFNICIPPRTKSLLFIFSLPNDAVAFLQSNIELQPFSDNFRIDCAKLSPLQQKTISVDLHPLWSPTLIFSAQNPNQNLEYSELAVDVAYYDCVGNFLPTESPHHKLIVGEIKQTTSHACRIFVGGDKTAQMSDERSLSMIQLEPPESANRMDIRIENKSNECIVPISTKIFLYDDLILDRLSSDSYHTIAEIHELPIETKKLLLESLVRKFPIDLAVLEQALNAYQDLGEIDAEARISTHILNKVKAPILRHHARLTLAKAESLSESWLPRIDSQKRHRDVPTPELATIPKVARFLGTYILNDVDLAAFNQKQIEHEETDCPKKFFVAPLGFPELGHTGQVWESRQYNDATCYLLNCVSRETLATVPITTQMNFSTLLSAKILEKEQATMIHIATTSTDYSTVLIAVALSIEFNIPLVLEFLDSFGYDDLSSRNVDEVSKKILLQQLRAAKLAHAIVINSERSKMCLIRHEIDPGNIFMVPFAESENFSFESPIRQHNPLAKSIYREIYTYASKKIRSLNS